MTCPLSNRIERRAGRVRRSLYLFMGKLGRERVCPLFKGEVENPSDIDGIVYIDMDAPGAWRETLRREISAAIEAVPSE